MKTIHLNFPFVWGCSILCSLNRTYGVIECDPLVMLEINQSVSVFFSFAFSVLHLQPAYQTVLIEDHWLSDQCCWSQIRMHILCFFSLIRIWSSRFGIWWCHICQCWCIHDHGWGMGAILLNILGFFEHGFSHFSLSHFLLISQSLIS